MRTGYKFSTQLFEKGTELGYLPGQLPLLFLVPFVQVAWAEGFVQAGERKVILRLAENFNIRADHPAYEQLLVWFNERPTEEFFARSIEDLSELLENIPAGQAARLRKMLQLGCFEVAHAAGDIGLLRGRTNIRREERAQLQYIADSLGLKHRQV